MTRLFRFSAFFLIFFILITNKCFAESNYVLPYPSHMPGSVTYKLSLVFEKISRYWYFGDFGQFNYSLKMADKYLVQAKTLFEYKQYLLAYETLEKSNSYFTQILPYLEKAKSKNKDISNKKFISKQAALKHIEVLEKIDAETPDIFTWQSEKTQPINLYLKENIKKSVDLRRRNL